MARNTSKTLLVFLINMNLRETSTIKSCWLAVRDISGSNPLHLNMSTLVKGPEQVSFEQM